MARETKINDLISSALRRSQRRNSEIETIIKNDVQDYIREEICTIYPFWFLRTEVGRDFFSNIGVDGLEDQAALDTYAHLSFPLYPAVDYWLDRGILRLEAGKDVYDLHAPAENLVGDTQPAYWKPAKCQKPEFAKLLNLQGQDAGELTIPRQNVALQHNNASEGRPCIIYFEPGREVDRVRVVPTPDRSYLVAISWVLSEPLNYYLEVEDATEDNYSNRFMQEYTEIYKYIVMLKAAEYFGDLPNIDFYMKSLYGASDMSTIGTSFGGKIGNLKRAHQRKHKQNAQSVATYKTNPMRRSSGRRSSGRGHWPGTYGR